jgi:hypothetical protein
VPGERFDALVKAEDVWGNPCERFQGTAALETVGASLDGLPPPLAFRNGGVAVARLTGLRLRAPATETRIAALHDGHRAESNLVRALASGEAKTFWGDQRLIPMAVAISV